MVAESENGTVYVYGDGITVDADNVYIEYTEQTEYTNNEILLMINQNIADGVSLFSGFFGLLFGFICCKELLKIWLQ